MDYNQQQTSFSGTPSQISQYANGESIDFSVKAARDSTVGAAIAGFIFSFFWLVISGTIGAAFFGPLFFGKEVNFTMNGRPVTASLENFEPLIFPAAFIGFFILIGLVIFAVSLIGFFKKGPWVVATPSRLILIYPKEVKSYDWEQFTGSTSLSGNDSKGSVTLEMRTGRMVSRKNGPDRYVPDRVAIIGIPGAAGIEQICRRRIKENDPTPSGNPDRIGNIV